MTDMTLEQVRDSLLKLSKGRMDYVELRAMADAIDANLAKASDYERAVTEQAMLTECVSVTGRDPSDVIRDVIQWHVSNAAQPVEAVDVTTFEVTLAEGSPEFINGYLLGESPGESGFWLFHPNGRNYNGPFDEREEALMVARRLEPAALAHPRPTGGSWSVKVPADRMAEAILSMQGPDGEALDGTLWLGQLDDGTYGVHLSCDECPEEGSITLAVLPAPTGEQAGEVVAWLYSWRDPLHEAERTVVADACESRARQRADQHGATLIPLYAQPRSVGVPEGYRLVPVEPTDDMCRNAREKIGIGSNVAHHVWHWMIAAVPDGEVG